MPDDLKKIIIRLEKSEQQLVALNKQLDASNQQLSATEQQLRAYNHQLEANGQQLRAANQQLVASEKTLKHEKEFSESLLETANTLIVTLDVDANITLFNKFAEEFTGHKKVEVLGKNWFNLFISKDDSSVIPKVFNDVLKDMPEASSHTNPILIKDGSERLISWENTIVKNDNGEISGILSIGNDITERKQSEQDIIRKNEQLELILQGGNLGWWDWDIPSGKEKYNEILAENLGYELNKIEPHISWWEDKIHTDDLKQVSSDLQNHFDRKTKYYENKHRLKTKSGEWKWFLDHGKVVEWDEDDKPIRMIGILRDIDKLERSAVALRESEETYRNIFNNAQVGLFRTRIVDGKLLEVNNTLARMSGYDNREHYIKEYDPEKEYVDAGTRERMLKEITSAGYINNFEARFYNIDGSIMWASFSAKIFQDKGWIEGVLEDITERKRSEEALRLSEEKYRDMTNLLPQAVYETDINGNFTYVNEYALDLFGYSKAEFDKGINIIQTIVPEIVEKAKVNFQQVLLEKSDNDPEFVALKKDGTTFPILVYANAIIKDNVPVGIRGIIIDITESKKAENKLRESENRFESFMNYMPAGIFIKDSDGHYLFSNKFNKDRFDISNIEGKTSYDFFTKEIADEFTKNDKRVLNGENILIQGSVTDKNKKLFYYKNHQFTIEQSDGKKLIGGISFDITKEKKAEEEIRKLSTAVHQSPSVLVITDLNGIIEYVNPKFTELTGYTYEEAMGLNPKILNSGEQSDEMFKELWQTISSGKEWYGEFHNKKKNGKFFWESASVSAIFDNKGEIINYLKVAEDITQRKRTEQIQNVLFNISNAVIRTNDLKDLIEIIRTELANIVDTKNFYIALYDSKTDTISSPFMADEKDSFVTFPAGKTLTYYVIKTEKPLLATKEKLKELEESGEVEGFGSNSEIWLGVPLKISGKVTGVFAVQSYTDENAYDESDCEVLEFIADQISISIDRKKAEQDLIQALEKATESDRLKTAFLNNFSHEIRTPMNGILGFVGLLKKPELSGEEKDQFIQIIETSSDRMLSTVDDLVNISMIESNQMKVLFSDTNINEQTSDINNLLKLEAENKGLKLLLQNSLPDDEAEISTDSAKLYAILTNIVKNAIKFTHTGSIIFGYHLVGKNIEFFVSDSGIGIPKDRQTAIFDRFVKADIEDKAVFEGSGLGLSIAKAFVEMLGGDLWVESEEGIGSKFYFTIPYNPVQKELAKGKVTTPVVKSNSLPKKITILIVEDEEVIAEYLSIVLKDMGTSLLYSSNGFEAVEVCRNNPNINLVLMDLKMPVMGGYEATRQIRSFNKDVIIIAQTAYALKGDQEKAIDAGCNDYISKPINRDKLIEMIGKWV